MSLRDAKEVVREAYLVAGLSESNVVQLIRADRAAVIAEAKDVVRQFATVEQPTEAILAALDDILKEKE